MRSLGLEARAQEGERRSLSLKCLNSHELISRGSCVRPVGTVFLIERPTDGADGGFGSPRAAVDELVHRLAARKRVPHAIVRVEHGDGFRWTGAVGDARPGGPPIRADMPFFIASVTKLYIATVVMKLHEGGQVRLSDPISTYLSGELTKGLHRLGGVDRTEEITVRHLLGHASGLPDYLEERPRGGRSLLERVVEEGDTAWDIHDIVRIVRGLRPHFPPQPLQEGRYRIRYSDTNYLLLIAVIEAVTGRRQHDAFEHLLFRPLHLRHTWLPGHSEPLAPTGDPAAIWYRDRPLHIPQAMSSFRDLYSTLDDTIAFLRALVGGEMFEDPATLDLMTSRWMRFGFPRDMAALRAPGWPIRDGLLAVLVSAARPVPLGHRGPGHGGCRTVPIPPKAPPLGRKGCHVASARG